MENTIKMKRKRKVNSYALSLLVISFYSKNPAKDN